MPLLDWYFVNQLYALASNDYFFARNLTPDEAAGEIDKGFVLFAGLTIGRHSDAAKNDSDYGNILSHGSILLQYPLHPIPSHHKEDVDAARA